MKRLLALALLAGCSGPDACITNTDKPKNKFRCDVSLPASYIEVGSVTVTGSGIYRLRVATRDGTLLYDKMDKGTITVMFPLPHGLCAQVDEYDTPFESIIVRKEK